MTEKLVDPVVISSITQLELIARQAVEGAVAGLHHSHFMGRNIEFSEHRPYHPGDELRHVDWRAYAKTDRFHVKLFEEDTNLRATILIDMSGSMRFGESTQSKLDYARQLTAALSYLIISQGDSVGLAVYDSEIRSYVPPRLRADQWGTLLETLSAAQTTNEVSATGLVLSNLGEFLKKRGMVILVSDLIEEPAQVLSGLALLRKRHQEVLVFHILTPEEIELPYSGSVEFHPLEGDAEPLLTAPRRLRTQYRERVERFLSQYRDGCLEHGIDYNSVTTRQPLEVVLREYLQRRLKTHRHR